MNDSYFPGYYFRFSDDLRLRTNASDSAILIHGLATYLICAWERSFPEPDSIRPIGLLSHTLRYLPNRTFVLWAYLFCYCTCSAFSGHLIGPLAAARCALVACPDRQGSYELLARYCLNSRSYGKLPELSFIRQTYPKHICNLSGTYPRHIVILNLSRWWIKLLSSIPGFSASLISDVFAYCIVISDLL